jgi:hypothetical protein
MTVRGGRDPSKSAQNRANTSGAHSARDGATL